MHRWFRLPDLISLRTLQRHREAHHVNLVHHGWGSAWVVCFRSRVNQNEYWKNDLRHLHLPRKRSPTKQLALTRRWALWVNKWVHFKRLFIVHGTRYACNAYWREILQVSHADLEDCTQRLNIHNRKPMTNPCVTSFSYVKLLCLHVGVDQTSDGWVVAGADVAATAAINHSLSL